MVLGLDFIRALGGITIYFDQNGNPAWARRAHFLGMSNAIESAAQVAPIGFEETARIELRTWFFGASKA